METDDEGFQYPKVNESICVSCGQCEKVCPFEREASKRIKTPDSFAARIKDDGVRIQSSSGGIFTALSNDILEEGGVVYGVAMSENLKSAYHIRVDSVVGLELLRGSKYLQASTGDIYKQVRLDLKNGRKVLFSGVPCQINGLKFFLQKDYDNLLLVEVICHGVPSPALWKKYFEYLEKKFNASIEKVNFREKRNGWKVFGLTEHGKNISHYSNQLEDPYMQMFLRDYCLRPSCYDCKVKKMESMADLTIADFWGVQNIAPEMDDDKGTSLVLLQSSKGIKAFESLKEICTSVRVSFDGSIKYNPAYFNSCKKPAERDTFFLDMNSMEFDKLQAKYCKPIKPSFIKRVLRKAKAVIKKMFPFSKKPSKA